MMGRPRKFDTTVVLLKAAKEFAYTGYSGTSVNQLVRSMGIGQYSFYAVFGSKEELFIEAFEMILEDEAEAELLIDMLIIALFERALVDPRAHWLARRTELSLIESHNKPIETIIYTRLAQRAKQKTMLS